MLRIDAHDRFDFGSDEYAALYASSDATAFQHPVWLCAFGEHLLPGRGAAWRVVAVRDGERLVAVLPMTTRRKTGVRLVEAADLGVSDYCAPVVAKGYGARIDWSAVREALEPFDVLRLRNVRPEHEAAWGALAGAEARGTDYGYHEVALAGAYDDWREAHVERSLASQSARKWKRWRKQGDVVCERVTDAERLPALIEKLTDLRSGRFDGDPIQDPFVRHFYSAVAVAGAGGFAETWVLREGDAVAGVLFGVTHGGAFHYLLIGCDYETFGRHSPGFHLYDRVIEDWMRRGGTAFDFTIGDEPFKSRYGARRVPIREFHAAGSLAGRIAGEVLRRRAVAA